MQIAIDLRRKKAKPNREHRAETTNDARASHSGAPNRTIRARICCVAVLIELRNIIIIVVVVVVLLAARPR